MNTVAGLLSDIDIKQAFKAGNIEIYPFDEAKQIQPGSVDLRLRQEFKRLKALDGEEAGKKIPTEVKKFIVPYDLIDDETLVINPGEIYLATTLETIRLSKDYAGFITGRSSTARLGVMVQCCQDFINPGHKQPIPLQLVNLGPNPVEFDLKNAVCQLVIFRLQTTPTIGYTEKDKAKYKNEQAPMGYVPETDGITQPVGKGAIRDRIGRLRKWLQNWVLPLLTSTMVGTIIVPILYNYNKDRSIGEIFNATVAFVSDIPFFLVFIAVEFLLYIWIKRG